MVLRRRPPYHKSGDLIAAYAQEDRADEHIRQLRHQGTVAHKTVRLRTKREIEVLGELGLRAPTVYEVRYGRTARPIMDSRYHVERPVRVRAHQRRRP